MAVDWWSQAAENLVMGTAAVESDLQYIKQVPGPALSLWQIQPATHRDIWQNWLAYRPQLAAAILRTCSLDPALSIPSDEVLMTNLMYGALMCRAYYRRIPEPLPGEEDVLGMARYWKTYYNTAEGAGTVEAFLRYYLKVHPLEGM